MRLTLIAIGKMKKGPETDLLQRYLDRAVKAGRQLGISAVCVTEHTESKSGSADLRKSEEARQMLGELKPGGFLVVLDENGKDISSIDLADIIRKNMENGVPETVFAIGGPDGHGNEMLNSADLVLRLGKLTWPHQLARVMLAEQLYRSVTIMSGHPYHRV